MLRRISKQGETTMIVLEDILNAIEDKKCEDVVAINTEGRNPFADMS